MSEIDSEAFRAWIEDRFGATDSQLRDWAFAYDDVLAAWNARAAAADRIAALESALRDIAERDHVEAMLDPDWSSRRARAALSDGGDHAR